MDGCVTSSLHTGIGIGWGAGYCVFKCLPGLDCPSFLRSEMGHLVGPRNAVDMIRYVTKGVGRLKACLDVRRGRRPQKFCRVGRVGQGRREAALGKLTEKLRYGLHDWRGGR
jgi:hypothetical protein